MLIIDNGASISDSEGKAFEKGCKVTRNQDESILYALSCPSEFKILDKTHKVLYATKSLSLEKNGLVQSFFTGGSKDYLIQFADISLHFFEDTKLKWSREEGLSQLTQIELLDQVEKVEPLDYIKHWQQDITID